MRLAADTGGTFTDLVVEDGDSVRLYKASTTPHDPADGILAAIGLAAADAGRELDDFLGSVELFIHGTTRAINAILTGTTARTALLCTRGHPDMLLLREGGRTEPFNWSYGYPDPYIARALTYEIGERVGSRGEVVLPLDEAGAVATIVAAGRGRGRGGRGLPAVVDREPGARARAAASCSSATCRACRTRSRTR